MEAGRLRKRIVIREKHVTQNEYGAEVPTMVEFATLWGAVEPLVGREYLEAKQVQADVSHKVKCRYLAGVKPSMEVTLGDRIFTIDSVINIQERGAEMVLMCREKIV